MRVLVFTGKGGVGTTTAAGATATLGALRGMRTLVVSVDAAHSLGDVFDASIGPDPTEVDDLLYAQQVDAQRLLEQSWKDVGGPLMEALSRAGTADPLQPEEAVVMPGLEELLVLLEIGAQIRSGRWDLLVVDGAPTAHALRLLALPDTVMYYLRRLFTRDRRALRAVPDGPSLIQRLHTELSEVRELLAGSNTTVRLVLTPETVVVAEARRAFTTLGLYGYRVDGIVANRLFPRHGVDPWRRQWIAAQDVALAEAEQSFNGTPIYRSSYRSCEPIGLGELAAFAAEAYGSADPFVIPPDPETGPAGDPYEIRFTLPNARTTDLALARKQDRLVLTVGSYRRVFTVPDEIRDSQVVGASLQDGQLVVRFGKRDQVAGSSSSGRTDDADRRGAWSAKV